MFSPDTTSEAAAAEFASKGRFTFNAAARFLGVGRTKVFELAAEGRLRRCTLPGGRPGVLVADCERLIAEGVEPGAESRSTAP